jgi:hypothetical protein
MTEAKQWPGERFATAKPDQAAALSRGVLPPMMSGVLIRGRNDNGG